jgi:hypothetical protein
MATQIKITQLTDIGSANLAVTTLLPVVNMAGVPTTQKTTLGNLANVILSQSGSNFARVALANLSYAVSNAAQPNITSTGTLTSLSVSGNANIGNIGTAGLITATGNVGAGNLNTSGLVNAGTLSVTGTTNLGAVGNVTITGGTNGQVLTTNGSNVLSWTTVSSSSSNTAVTVTANAQPNITSVGNLSYLVVNGNVDATNIDAANTVYANYFVGDGSSITDIDATNVIGNVANANYSTYAGTVITGAQPNITSVGNLAGLTITGVTTLGTVTNLGDVGNVKIDGGIDGDVLGTDGANLFWVAQTDIGNFSFSNNIISLNVPANLVVNSDGQNFIVNANSRLFTYKPDGNLVLPGGSQIYDNSGNLNIASNGLLLSVGPNANVHYDWWFSNTGNLTLPGNTFAVNYANGAQVSIGGGASTGNVTFDDNIVIGTGDEYGGDGLFLATGPNGAANLQYLRLRGGDFPTHIHLDTGNNAFYDQYFGNDNKFVKLEAGDAGNVVIGTDDATGNLYNWTFTGDGNFILANGNSVIQSIANSSLDPLNPNVSTMVLTPDPGYSSQALVLDPTAPGHIHLRAPGANIDEPGANIFLGGEDTSFEVTYGANNQAVIHSGGNDWVFGNDGVLTVPGNLAYIGASPAPSISGFNSANFAGNVVGANFIGTLANGNSNVSIATANGNVTIAAVGNTTMTVTGTGANITGTLTSTGKIGYASGSTVTQTTNRGNGVTINALAGTIITTSVAMVANEIDTFSVVNSSVDINNDIVLAQIVSPNQGTYNCIANPALIGGFNNGFYINIVNISGFTTADETITIRFMVIKAPNA